MEAYLGLSEDHGGRGGHKLLIISIEESIPLGKSYNEQYIYLPGQESSRIFKLY